MKQRYEEMIVQATRLEEFSDLLQRYANEGWDRVFTQINDVQGSGNDWGPYTAYYAIFRRRVEYAPQEAAVSGG